MKNIKLALTIIVSMALFTACNDAQVASSNLSKAADNFELERRIVFYDAIQGVYLLSIEGRCSISSSSTQLSVTCKTSSNTYKKHFLGISDNVTYFSEQLESAQVDVYHYRVIFKPAALIPSIELNN